ncbi:hypothetical protein G7Y79_00054g088610 [Physcia stellaris]|nr:hypothetical protein G7Y79_00054g088610 [Physcia stellaris]
MWEDYSFPIAAHRSSTDQDSSVTVESPSESSRGASPFSDDESIPAPCSITELSQHFQLQSLQAQLPSFPPQSMDFPPQYLSPLSQRERLTTTAHFNQRRKQRQTLTRRQCFSANLPRLSSLAQDLATLGYDASPTPLSPTPLSDISDSLPPLQIHEQPASGVDYIPTTSVTTADSDCCTEESQTPTASRPQFKVGKRLARSISKESLARQRLVYKDYEPQTPAPNSFLAIYQSQGSAQKLISVSPFLCKLEHKDSGWTYAGSEILNQVRGIDQADAPAPSIENLESLPEGEHGNEEEEAITGKTKKAAGGIKAEDEDSQGLSGSRERGLPPKGSLTDPAMSPLPSTDNKASPSASSAAASQPTAASVKEFKLWVTPSHMNHQAYIERQGYYTEFVPDRKTLMAKDFEDRVPLAGMVECRIDKAEVPLRIRTRRKERGLPEPFSIRAQWEKRHPPEP